jgi:hypothetical protein
MARLNSVWPFHFVQIHETRELFPYPLCSFGSLAGLAGAGFGVAVWLGLGALSFGALDFGALALGALSFGALGFGAGLLSARGSLFGLLSACDSLAGCDGGLLSARGSLAGRDFSVGLLSACEAGCEADGFAGLLSCAMLPPLFSLAGRLFFMALLFGSAAG